MSRKTLLSVLAVFGALAAFFGEQFGLVLDSTAILAAVTGILVYVFFEAKADLKRIGEQIGKFKDPKFLIALASTILVAISEAFGLDIPVEAIVAVLTLVMSVLFGKDAITAR